MQFATTRGETTMAALTSRLFKLDGPAAKARSKQVENALLQANPQLRNLTTVPPGATIEVPAIEGIAPTAEVQPVEDAARATLAALVTEVGQALTATGAALDAAMKFQDQEARETLQALKSGEFGRLAKEQPALQKRLPQIKQEATANLRGVAVLAAAQRKALTQVDSDLAAFLKQFGA